MKMFRNKRGSADAVGCEKELVLASEAAETPRVVQGMNLAVRTALLGFICLSGLLAQAEETVDVEVTARAAEIRANAGRLSEQVRRELPEPRKISRAEPFVFRAGAAEVDITPREPIYLDGYWNHRLSTGVHSPLHARAIVLDDGRTRIAFVILDLIAFFNEWVRETRTMQDAVPPENVTICTTHTHSSPCLLGVFGPPGEAVNMEYVNWVKRQTAEAIKQAAASLKPARAGFAHTELPVKDGEIVGVAVNWHNPGVVEPGLPIMRLEELETGKAIATMINFGNHPDVLGDQSTKVSADCFHYIYENVSEKFGGVTLVFNRAVGGVEPIGQGENDMDLAEEHMKRIGRVVSDNVAKAMNTLAWVESPSVSVRRIECLFPILSEWMIDASAKGMLPVKVRADGGTLSEMALFEVGPAQILTAPGEVHPEVAFKLLDMMKGNYRFVFSLADDEVGYIVPAELYNPEGIQEMLSTGADNERVVLNAAANLLGVDGYLEPECIQGMKSRLAE